MSPLIFRNYVRKNRLSSSNYLIVSRLSLSELSPWLLQMISAFKMCNHKINCELFSKVATVERYQRFPGKDNSTESPIKDLLYILRKKFQLKNQNCAAKCSKVRMSVTIVWLLFGTYSFKLIFWVVSKHMYSEFLTWLHRTGKLKTRNLVMTGYLIKWIIHQANEKNLSSIVSKRKLEN